MKLSVPTAFTVATLLGGSAALADPINIVQVNSSAQLAGPLIVEDFEDDTFVSGVRFEAPTGVTRVSAGAASRNITSSGTFGLIPTNHETAPIDIFFSRPVSSVGMFFGNDEPSTPRFTAFLDAFAGTTLVGSVGVTANMNDFADQFIGFNSNTAAISNVRFHFGPSDAIQQGVTPFIDDVFFDSGGATPSPTPEPASMLLMGTGLLGVLVRTRRRKQDEED